MYLQPDCLKAVASLSTHPAHATSEVFEGGTVFCVSCDEYRDTRFGRIGFRRQASVETAAQLLKRRRGTDPALSIGLIPAVVPV